MKLTAAQLDKAISRYMKRLSVDREPCTFTKPQLRALFESANDKIELSGIAPQYYPEPDRWKDHRPIDPDQLPEKTRRNLNMTQARKLHSDEVKAIGKNQTDDKAVKDDIALNVRAAFASEQSFEEVAALQQVEIEVKGKRKNVTRIDENAGKITKKQIDDIVDWCFRVALPRRQAPSSASSLLEGGV